MRIMTWQSVLERSDVLLQPLGPDRARVRPPEGFGGVVEIRRVRHRLDLAHVRRLLAGRPPDALPLLVAAPAATPGAVEALAAEGASLVTEDGVVRLAFGVPSAPADPRPTAPVRPTSRGPLPWALLTVARRLLHLAPARQASLARAAGVSQKTVSVTAHRLAGLGLCAPGPEGVTAPDRAALLRWWLSAYPLGEGLSAHYVSDRPLADQVRTVAALVDGRVPVLSGSLAADALAPWARPRRAVLHCDAVPDLDDTDLVPCPADAATLRLVVSPDPGVRVPKDGERPWAALGPDGSAVEIADPLQVLLDVAQDGGADSDQVSQRLTDWLLDGDGDRRLRDHLRRVCAGDQA